MCAVLYGNASFASPVWAVGGVQSQAEKDTEKFDVSCLCHEPSDIYNCIATSSTSGFNTGKLLEFILLTHVRLIDGFPQTSKKVFRTCWVCCLQIHNEQSVFSNLFILPLCNSRCYIEKIFLDYSYSQLVWTPIPPPLLKVHVGTWLIDTSLVGTCWGQDLFNH